MTRYISLLRNDEVIAQMEIGENITNDFVMELDCLLADNEAIKDNEEICITEDL